MKLFGLLSLVFCLWPLIGCSVITEGAKGVLGVSTKILEDGRKDAFRKIFDYDLSTTYGKVKEVLKISGCYIYAKSKDKSMIAVYVSESNTTPVGIFFTAVNRDATLVEISSPSPYAKELMTKQIIKGVMKGKSDAQEKTNSK